MRLALALLLALLASCAATPIAITRIEAGAVFRACNLHLWMTRVELLERCGAPSQRLRSAQEREEECWVYDSLTRVADPTVAWSAIGGQRSRWVVCLAAPGSLPEMTRVWPVDPGPGP